MAKPQTNIAGFNIDHDELEEASKHMQNIGKDQIDIMQSLIPEEEMFFKSKEELATLITLTRWTNPICYPCGTKEVAKLKKCMRCKLVFYCSKECQRKDWPKHKPNCKAK